MRAAFFKEQAKPLVIQSVEQPVPANDQLVVRLRNASLNHLDLWIHQEQKSPYPDGIILGSDGSGQVIAASEEVEEGLIGKSVVVNPGISWGNNPTVHANSFSILGFPQHGTFGDYLLISKKQVFEKPPHLSFEEASALPLAGLTAYRALFSRARVRPGEKVLITGIGGGAALFALQFALAFQCKVYVTSSADEKIEKATQLGATAGFNYKADDWAMKAKKEAGGFDVIIDSAAGKSFPDLVDLAYPGARIVMFGRTAGMIPDISPRLIYWKQLSILGTTMGSNDEFLSMLDYVEKHQIRPTIDSIFPLEEVNTAMQRMASGEHFGKIVLNIKS